MCSVKFKCLYHSPMYNSNELDSASSRTLQISKNLCVEHWKLQSQFNSNEEMDTIVFPRVKYHYSCKQNIAIDKS